MRSDCKGALPLFLAATSESGDVLVEALPAAGGLSLSATAFGAALGAKPPTAPTAAAGTFSFGGKQASAAAAATADSAVSVGDKGTCSESVAVALMQDLRNTVAALENEVALRMADEAELDDSSGAALPLQQAAVGVAAGGSNEGVGSAVCTGFEWTSSEPFALNYPFVGIHTVYLLKKVVTWEASTSGIFRSTDPKCTGFTAEDEDGRCASCAALGSSTFLRGVIARAAEKDCTEQPWAPSTSRSPSSKLAIKNTPRGNPNTAWWYGRATRGYRAS